MFCDNDNVYSQGLFILCLRQFLLEKVCKISKTEKHLNSGRQIRNEPVVTMNTENDTTHMQELSGITDLGSTYDNQSMNRSLHP